MGGGGSMAAMNSSLKMNRAQLKKKRWLKKPDGSFKSYREASLASKLSLPDYQLDKAEYHEMLQRVADQNKQLKKKRLRQFLGAVFLTSALLFLLYVGLAHGFQWSKIG